MGHESDVRESIDLDSPDGWDVIHLHYVPFSYSGWGLGARKLIQDLSNSKPLVVTVHETRVPFGWSARSAVLSTLQAFVLRTIRRRAAAIVVPTLLYEAHLGGAETILVPSGSILPLDVQPRMRSHERPRMAVITSKHPDRMQRLAVRACEAAAQRTPVDLVALGGGQLPRFSCHGLLDAQSFADVLATCDLVLLPYADGVTSRRTSFMSALQVAVPVLTTVLPTMKDFTINGALEATLPTEGEAFVGRAVRLAMSPQERFELSRRGRELFDREFSWPLLARRLIQVYEGVQC